VDAPNQVRSINNANAVNNSSFCREVRSFKDNLDFRLRGSVPIKGGFNASFIYRNTPGAAINTTLTVSGSNVRFLDPSRTSLTTAQAVNVTPTEANFGDRFSQLDVAISKNITVPGIGRLRTSFDIYNALNSNSVQGVTGTFGARYLRPSQVLDPRLMRITASIDF
jgi:hypothetical protein